MRTLRNAVVVITGASSGIGRATALEFARAGARVVVAARRPEPLEATAEDCRMAGAEALAVVTDVTDEAAVMALARAAIERFGRIDVWFNNVGTGVFGPFTAAPVSLHRRVIEANLFGTLHGAAAVLPVFLRQQRGVLINMISMGGWSPTPFAAAYAASKFGLRGFTASLRQELHGTPGIRVCAVFPALVDTPGLAHAANVSGRSMNPPGPYIAPEAVARTVVRLARNPRDEVAVGLVATIARIAYGLAPGLTERVTGVALRGALRRAGHAPRTEGALVAPVLEGTTASGGMRERQRMQRSTAGSVMMGPTGVALAGAALVLGAELLVSRRRDWRRM